jgi:O-antigen/teichoic acid export membrane protein
LSNTATIPAAPSQAAPSLSRTIFRNLLALTSGQFSERLIAMVTAAYLARTLGPTGLGATVYSFAVAGYLTLIVGAGLDVVAGRAVTRDPLHAPVWTSHTLAFRAMLAGLSYCTLILLSGVFPWTPLQRSAILAACLVAFANAFQLDWLYQAQDRMHVIALRKALAQLVTLASVLLLVRTQADVIPAVLCPTLGLGFGVLWVLRTSRREYHWTWLRPDLTFLRGMFRDALPVFLSGAMILTYQQFSVLLLARYRSMDDLGLFGACLKLYAAIGGLQILVNTSIYPTFCRLASQPYHRRQALLHTSASTMNFVAAVVSLAMIVAAGPLLRYLFGPSYQQAAPILQVLAIAQFLVFNQCVTSPYLYAIGRQGQHLLCVASGAAVNIACNLFLVPLYGAIGGAWSMVISEITVFSAMYFFVRRANHAPIPGFLITAVAFCLVSALVVVSPPGPLLAAGWLALLAIVASRLPRLLSALRAGVLQPWVQKTSPVAPHNG